MMINTNLKIVLIALFLVPSIHSCKDEKPVTSNFLNPPFPELAPEYASFQIDAAQGDTVVLESGTEFIVEGNSLYDSLGNNYSGPVEIKFREFTNAIDIYLAGIPMEYFSMGRRKQMITAGMLELRAYDTANNELFLKNIPIKLKYASKTEGPDYNFFGLNEEEERWEFLDYPEAEVNPEVQRIKDRMKALIPERKFPFGKEYFVFNYDAIIDVHFNMDERKFMDWANKGREEIPEATRKAQRYGLTWSGLHNYGKISFYGNSIYAAMMVWKYVKGDPLTGPIDAPYKSTMLTHLSGNLYELNVFVDEGFTYHRGLVEYSEDLEKNSITVECIMPLQSLYKYPPKYWKKNYDDAMNEIAEYEKQYAEIAKVYRNVEIYQFGYYNFDKLMKTEDALNMYAKFKYKNSDKSIDQVNVMPGDNRSLIDVFNNNKVWLDETDTNFRIFTITDDLKIAVFPKEDYMNINFDSLRNVGNPEYTFELEVINKKVDSRQVLEEILNGNY